MNRLFFALLFAVQMWAIPAAHADEQTTTKWRGYIIDRQCADSVRHDTDPLPFLKHHSKDCSLMPSCKRDGYSLYTDGQWLDLNKKSSTSVFQAIKASKRKKGFYAEVAGKVEDKLVTVEKVTEIEEPEQPAEGRSEAK